MAIILALWLPHAYMIYCIVCLITQARDHHDTETAKRYNCIALFLNITAIVTGIAIIAIIIAARVASQ